MAYVFGLNDLSDALIKTGKALLGPHSSTNELLTLLDETESLLKKVDQDQPLSMQNVLTLSKNALISSDLLNHPDSDVRVSLVSCLTEMFRITSPNPPYNDDQMKEIFRLTVEAFEKLADADLSSRSYKKAESVLVLVSKLKSCLIMLDLECDDLILQMFRMFLNIIRYDHPRVVFESMEMIMIIVIDETDEVSRDLLDTLLDCVKKENQTVSPMSWSLAEKVLRRCGCKLKPYIINALRSTGSILDMYYPVLTTICNTVDTPKVHNVVEPKENEAVGTELVAPNDSLKDKLVLGNSRMETRSKSSSKRPATQSQKQVQSESTDLGVTGKRGRKPNSLMNPDEGYDMPWISGKRDSFKTPSKRNGSGGESSVGKLAAKKTPPAKESSPATSRALTGSVKRSRFNMDEDQDLDSFSSPRVKKLASSFRDEEPLEKESNQESYETPEDDRKIENSRRKTRSQNGVEISPRTAKKKPIVEPKIVNSSGRRSSALLDAKKKNVEAGSPDTPVPQSSKGKKKVSQVAARPLAEETSKRHPTRSQTARKEVESDTNGFGEDLVGKRVNIWWPLDNTFYEGVVESYSSRKKMHRVVYYDGESEQLNLVKERWELLEDLSSQEDDEQDLEIDLPDSIPLSDIMQKQKVKRGKGESKAAKTDRREEQEVSRDVDQESEMQEQSEESLKLTDTEEAEAKEVEKQYPNSEAVSEREEGSESEEEPKWRETDDVEDEAEEVDDEVTSLSETEKDADEEPKWRETDDMEDEAEEVDDKVLSEIEKEADEES